MTLKKHDFFPYARATPGLKYASFQRGSGSVLIMLAVCMVLAVLAVLVVLLKLGMSKTYTAHTEQLAYEHDFNQANDLLQSVDKISNGIAAVTSSSGLGQGISTSQVAEMGLFPTGSVSGLGVGQVVVARNELAGQYLISGNAESVGQAAASTGYFMYLTGIPKTQCPFLANSLAHLANDIWLGPDRRFTLPRGFDSSALSPDMAMQVQSFGHPMAVSTVAEKCNRSPLVTIVLFRVPR